MVAEGLLTCLLAWRACLLAWKKSDFVLRWKIKVKHGEIRWALIRKTFILEAVVYCDSTNISGAVESWDFHLTEK